MPHTRQCTSAAAAAYAARAGLQAIIVIPKGKVALGKLAQAVVYGAEIIEIDGNFDEALAMVREISETTPVTLVNSVNPHRIEGQKTAAFEIVDALNRYALLDTQNTNEYVRSVHSHTCNINGVPTYFRIVIKKK